MSKSTRCLLAGWVLSVCSAAVMAQAISAEEMVQLEALRSQITAMGGTVTPEMEVRMLQRLRAAKAINSGGLPALLAAQGAGVAGGAGSPLPAVPVISEDDLAKQVSAISAPHPVSELRFLRDGLEFDGQRFADPQGRASNFATDQATGRVGYVVTSGMGDSASVKLARLDQGSAAVLIGQLRRSDRGWQFTSVTGKTLGGDLFFPLTDGVLLMRDSVGFRYTAGKGVQQVNIPGGWSPTPIQRGNVSATGWLLLEKDNAEEKKSPLGMLKNMGNLLGAGNFNEYALLQMGSGKLVEIDIPSNGKNTFSFAQCRRKNAVVNQCDKVSSYESLFQPNGMANSTHYFWRIDWQRGPKGAMLIASEGSLASKLNAYDLESGRKVLLMERTLGVTNLEPRLNAEGRYSVRVQLGLTHETVDDIAASLAKGPDLTAGAVVAAPAASATQP